ncbi:MAG: hypothetical protein IJU39_05865 [Clostridia bacterium]|nr:hypothetical protein [Clostridia bacterium]
MKKTVAILLVFIMAFFACSCGGKSDPKSPEEKKYVFESSEKQKVYKNGNNYMIFYYKGDEISGIDTVMTFQTEEAATSSLEVLQKSANKTAEIVREGKFIVMHMSDEYISDYKIMTVDGIESYLKAQGYVLVEKIEEEETTAADAKKTTAKSEEKTTAKSGEKTTAKSDEKTTAKPAETTTAAPKK